MKNPKELAKTAINDKSDAVCVEAVKDLFDQALLAEVAKNTSKSEVGINAIAKITEEAFLADVALHAKDKYNRKRAIERLTDQAVLSDISMNDVDNDVRKSAQRKMNDNEMKSEIDKNKKQQKYTELTLAEALQKPKPLSPDELKALKDPAGGGIKIKELNDMIVQIAAAIAYAVDPVNKAFVQSEYELLKGNTSDEKLLLVEGDALAILSFIFKTLIKWQEHLDWEDKGYKIQVNLSKHLLIQGFCKDFQGNVYFKTITLFKTEVGFAGWGESDFQKLLKELKPSGLFVTG
jgi:hypothetical protein